jgi:hypothetical protein
MGWDGMRCDGWEGQADGRVGWHRTDSTTKPSIITVNAQQKLFPFDFHIPNRHTATAPTRQTIILLSFSLLFCPWGYYLSSFISAALAGTITSS